MPRTLLMPLMGVAAAALPAAASAQTPELPQPSPEAHVAQTVGLTKVEVTYSSPGAKGRKVWGKLVPYGEMWRTGANKATRVTFDRAVTVGGKPVPKGAYSLFTIPKKKRWTVVLNRETELWGTGKYDAKQDQARFEVRAEKAPFRERLTFVFSDTTAEATRLDLEWAGLRVSLPIQAGTAAQVEKNIQAATDQAWRPHERAARYLLDNGGDKTRALGLVDGSIAIKETWRNRWVRAQILEALGRKKAARKDTRRALALGDDSGGFRFYSKRMKAYLKK